MLQIFFGIYLVLGLSATLLLWMALVAAKTHESDEGYDGQHNYQLGLAIANLKNEISRRK